VEANTTTVQKGIRIVFVRLAPKPKYVPLLHWQDGRCDLGIRLENLAWVDVPK
jgi:hypothetical protein